MESGTTTHQPNLDSILQERRVFPPPAEFAAQAHVKSLEQYDALYTRSIQDPEASGRRSRANCTGFLPGPVCLIGSPRSPGGSWTAKSISATTASTVTP